MTFKKLFHLVIACAIGMTVTAVCLADDTEIYLGSNNFTGLIQPNVTFVIDTSGSMSSTVTITQGTYDPAQTYAGTCDSSRVYWRRGTGNAPSCTTSNWIDTASNVCLQSQAPLSTGSGFYVDRMARYRVRSNRTDKWRRLSSNNHTSLVECQADFGVHGDGGSATLVYPANQNNGGPFISTATNAVNWGNTGSSYTLYSANYLNWKENSSNSIQKTRLQVVQEVFSNLVDSTSGINATVMRFDDKSQSLNKGGYFLLPMTGLDATSRPIFKNAVNALTTGGYTPLAETLYEAARFYRDENVKFGNSTTPGTNDPGVLDASNSNKYKSPIEYACQKNFVVFLTDGTPTYDYNADNDIQALPGFTNVAGTCGGSDDCMDEVADYLHTQDQRSSLEGKQNVSTFTIGFTTNQTLLSQTAQKGGGSYYTADDTAGLTDAFTSIISQILSINTSFVAPAIPVNAYNRLTHLNELYFALFRPEETPRWGGNIKRYELSANKTIADANGVDAIDPNTGFFKSTSTSSWTLAADAPDGDVVAMGGAAGKLALARNLYTYTGATDPANESLTASSNLFHESNLALTKTLLAIPGQTDAYRTSLVQWSRGIDLFDDDADGSFIDARRTMGDPLHTLPVLVNYGGTAASPDITLFASTNEGFLHAISSTDGNESFGFIPQELLGNLVDQYENAPSVNHPYGLDGPITAWVKDINNNGRVLDAGGSVEPGEHVYLYLGMRRGGKTYYALDVTDRSAPVLKWKITGGTGAYAEMGQTWSRPKYGRIQLNGVVHDVIIIGGGYDATQDSTDVPQVDTEGRAIYIVDADTGQRLWWAGPTTSTADFKHASLVNSIPASVTPVDIDLDGLVDVLFTADIGGRIWRFDIDNANNTGAANLATGGVIADFSGVDAATNRRFYYKPDVAFMYRNGTPVFSIAIGTGYRAHPLQTMTQDRFYTIFDSNVHSVPATYTPLSVTDLYNATTNLTLGGLSSKSGWYIDLTNAGEKVLAESRTVDGVTMFTTFTPGSSTACSPSQGVARFYAVGTLDALPAFNLDTIGSNTALTVTDRSVMLTRGGIPPTPTLLFPSDGSAAIVLVGTEKVADVDYNIPIQRTGWHIE